MREKVAREREGTASERVPFANDDGGTEREETRATSPSAQRLFKSQVDRRHSNLSLAYSSPDRITNHVCAVRLVYISNRKTP